MWTTHIRVGPIDEAFRDDDDEYHPLLCFSVDFVI